MLLLNIFKLIQILIKRQPVSILTIIQISMISPSLSFPTLYIIINFLIFKFLIHSKTCKSIQNWKTNIYIITEISHTLICCGTIKTYSSCFQIQGFEFVKLILHQSDNKLVNADNTSGRLIFFIYIFFFKVKIQTDFCCNKNAN